MRIGGLRSDENLTGRWLLSYFNSVNYADNGCVNRTFLAAEGHARRASLHYQDNLSKARAHSIHHDNVAFFVLAIHVNKARDKQLAPGQAVVFSRGNHGSNYSS
jgi:hypothetical protein